MLRHYIIAIVFSLLLIPAIPASAEFYQYVDSKGITHFTDNISTIPTEYQSQLEQHEEIILLPEEDSDIDKLTSERKILLDKKEALNKKFETLAAEKKELENTKGDMKDEASVARYNDSIRAMNEKIKQYKAEEKRFKAEIERYNKLIEPLTTE